MDVTFQEFKKYVESQFKTQEKFGIRYGQALMNCLWDKNPNKRREIIGSHIDCFYDDKKIKDALDYLERHWND